MVLQRTVNCGNNPFSFEKCKVLIVCSKFISYVEGCFFFEQHEASQRQLKLKSKFSNKSIFCGMTLSQVKMRN